MRLRQVAFVAENLMQVREELFQLLGLSEDYADPGVGEFGLENSVSDPNWHYCRTTARATGRRWRLHGASAD